MVSTYERYGTVRFKASFYNFAGSFADPSNPLFRVYNNKETIVLSTEITPSATGKYYYDMYSSMAVGPYIGEFVGKLDNKPARKRFKFMIKATTV